MHVVLANRVLILDYVVSDHNARSVILAMPSFELFKFTAEDVNQHGVYWAFVGLEVEMFDYFSDSESEACFGNQVLHMLSNLYKIIELLIIVFLYRDW